MYVLDSPGRLSARTVADAGYGGIVRYIGYPGHSRCVTRAELDDHASHGVDVALVHDRAPDDWRGGYPAGHAAATVARAHASGLEFPDDRPIYFAVGEGAGRPDDFAQARDYVKGAADALGVECVGVYGSRDVVTMAHGASVATYFWQQREDPPTVSASRVHLYQLADTVTLSGVECGVNSVRVPDWGQRAVNADVTSTEVLVDAMVSAVESLSDEAVRRLAVVYATELARRRRR